MLKIWVTQDPDGHDYEERCAHLFAASTAEAAEAMWRNAYGFTPDDARCEVKPAEWLWPDVPEPIATSPGSWTSDEMTPHGKLFRGFGFWEEDDPRCDECGELSPAELGMREVDGFAICPGCHQPGTRSGHSS